MEPEDMLGIKHPPKLSVVVWRSVDRNDKFLLELVSNQIPKA